MKKILALLLFSLVSALVVGCSDIPDTPDTPDVPITQGYKDPSHKKGTYKVEFVLRDRTVTHFYEAGELPEPPEVKEEKVESTLLVFDGWDREIVTVSENAKYIASYIATTYEYTATFALGGGRTIKVKTTAGHRATPPRVADYNGMQFACWDREIFASNQDVTYTAIYTDVLEPERMEMAFRSHDFIWASVGMGNLNASVALYSLVLQEHENPMCGPVRDRIIEQLAFVTAKDSASDFNCSTNWAHSILSAALAMAKDTPSVWDAMSVSLKKRVDTFMKALIYVNSLGTSDQNFYQTGPSFIGNYKNNWNVNYALGNIPCMVFAVYYFGNGDIEKGADAVNTMLKGFNEAEYNRMISDFQAYGWKRAYECWTTPAPKTGYSDAMQMLVYGGEVVGLDYMDTTGNTIKHLGTGLGVTNGGMDFTYTLAADGIPHSGEYKSISLYEPERIVQAMIDYNFAMKTKSDLYFNDERVAYILDGTASPYEGMMGMMYEFGLPNRSAITYTSHDLNMIVPIMSAARTLKRYENGVKTDAPIYDFTEDAERFSRIQVGMEDFIYKYRHGYRDFVSYNQGGGIDILQYETNADLGYWVCKGIWRTTMKPLGDLPIAEMYD